MSDESTIRIDKWLWAMRLFKTRSLAAQACNQNRIFINEKSVKPSREIRIGIHIQLKRTGLTRTVEVLQLTDKRLSAKLVAEYYKDHTPQKELDDFKARVARASSYRDPGEGRPTKKDRRDMDDFLSAADDIFDE